MRDVTEMEFDGGDADAFCIESKWLQPNAPAASTTTPECHFFASSGATYGVTCFVLAVAVATVLVLFSPSPVLNRAHDAHIASASGERVGGCTIAWVLMTLVTFQFLRGRL